MSSPIAHNWCWQVDGGGWLFSAPPPPFRRLLCYDNLDGATLLIAADLAGDVLALHHDRAELERLRGLMKDAGASSVRFAHVDDDLKAVALDGFDGVIVHDPEARVLRRNRGAPLPIDELCARLASTLRPQGFMFLGVCNRYSYQRIRRYSGRARLLSVPAATRAMRQAGLAVQPPQPFLIQGTRISGIVPPGGYESAKNPFLPGERLRELLLRGWGRDNLAPFYGVIGFRGVAEKSRLERLLADPWTRSLAPPDSVILRCLVLNWGKIVLSVGPLHASHGTVVLVANLWSKIPPTRLAEAEWLRRLATLPPKVSGVIPVFLGERQIGGCGVTAYSEQLGMTVDHNVRYLPHLTTAAAAWLREFHKATAHAVQMNAFEFDRVFAHLFEKARARNPQLSSPITALEEQVRGRLMGQELLLSWMHGDFKLENVVFDQRTLTLQGVIDWDRAWDPGPPLVDLLYLLLYNRVVRTKIDLIAAARQGLVRQDWTADERELLEAHHNTLGTRGLSETAMGALFLIHHIGVRFIYDLQREDTLADLCDLLVALRDKLAAEGS